MGDKLIAIGGENIGRRSQTLKTAEYLVLGEDTWRKLPEMHEERAGSTACVIPD